MPASSVLPPPRWARVADFACLLLVLLAAVVAMWGGFRMRVGGVRLALTSPYRVLVWAAAIALVRHLAAPQQPIYRDLPARARAAWRRPPLKHALTALVATRLPILFVGYLAVFTIGFGPQQRPWRLVGNELVNLQARWDTGWYYGIAIEGYSYLAHRADEQQNIVFFPAMPMLMRLAGRLLGGSSTAFMAGGTLVSLLAFCGALIYLFRLAREMLGGEDAARHAVWLLAAYPFAVFYGAVYTESLFLVGAAGAFYHFGRREWWQAAGWGLLVGLTRPNGCFLSIPLAVLAVAPWLPPWLRGAAWRARDEDDERPGSLARAWPSLVAAAAPGMGVLAYSGYVWYLTGHPLTWAEGHVAWGRSYQGLSILVTDRYKYVSEAGLYGYTSELPLDLMQALAVLFVLAAAWPVTRQMGAAYSVFILVNILPPLAAGGLLSAGRFSAVLFPAFFWLAGAVPDRHRTAWVVGFMAFQAFNAALFYTWRPMF
jgi:hypothetical protein